MRINKKKLMETLKIINKTPKECIEWINDNINIKEIYLCNNLKYFNRGERIVDVNYNETTFRKKIIVPDFVKLNKKEKESNTFWDRNCTLSRFSILIYYNKKARNQIIKILENLNG